MAKVAKKLIIENILKTVNQSSNILLHLHKFPDLDSIGSCIAMASYLKNLGKQVTILSGETGLNSKYQILPGFDFVSPESLKDTDHTAYDLFIFLDCASLDRVSDTVTLQDLLHLKTINIDHHPGNTINANINLLCPDRSSTSELVFEIFNTAGHIPTYLEALNLYLGIESDTGSFRLPFTDWKVFAVVSKLSKIAPDFNNYLIQMATTEPESLNFIRLALENQETFFNGLVLISGLSNKELSSNNILDIHARRAYIADLFNSTRQYKIICILTEFEKGKTVAVFRTFDRELYNVSTLASNLGGGGHAGASAVTIHHPLAEAKDIILEEIRHLYNFDAN